VTRIDTDQIRQSWERTGSPRVATLEARGLLAEDCLLELCDELDRLRAERRLEARFTSATVGICAARLVAAGIVDIDHADEAVAAVLAYFTLPAPPPFESPERRALLAPFRRPPEEL
jgi:hypothetical protein